MPATGPAREAGEGVPSLRRTVARCLVLAGGTGAAWLLASGIASGAPSAVDLSGAAATVATVVPASAPPAGGGGSLAGSISDPSALTGTPLAAAPAGTVAMPAGQHAPADRSALGAPPAPFEMDAELPGAIKATLDQAATDSVDAAFDGVLDDTLGGAVERAVGHAVERAVRRAVEVAVDEALDGAVNGTIDGAAALPALTGLGPLPTVRPLAHPRPITPPSGDRHQPGLVAAHPAVAAGADPAPAVRISAPTDLAGAGRNPAPAATPDQHGVPSLPGQHGPQDRPCLPMPVPSGSVAAAPSAVEPSATMRPFASWLHVRTQRCGPAAEASVADQPGVTPD